MKRLNSSRLRNSQLLSETAARRSRENTEFTKVQRRKTAPSVPRGNPVLLSGIAYKGSRARKCEAGNGFCYYERTLEPPPSDYEDEEWDEDSLKELLQGLGKIKLFDLVRHLAVKDIGDPKIFELREAAKSDPARCKIFVRSLPFDVDSDKLTKLYTKYGHIEEAFVIKDRVTGKSKGGRFEAEPDVKDGALKSVEGWVIMVPNLNEETLEDDIYDRFSEHGGIQHIHLNLDRRTAFVKG